jgi:hypothetical protein
MSRNAANGPSSELAYERQGICKSVHCSFLAFTSTFRILAFSPSGNTPEPSPIWSTDGIADSFRRRAVTLNVGLIAGDEAGAVMLRWSPIAGQFGGWDKLGSDFRQAASLSILAAPHASSGVRPARAEWGRPAL